MNKKELTKETWRELCQKKVLNVDELSLYTGLSKSHIYKGTMSRILPHSKPTNGRCFFDREKIDQWLLSNPVITVDELKTAAVNHVTLNSRLS